LQVFRSFSAGNRSSFGRKRHAAVAPPAPVTASQCCVIHERTSSTCRLARRYSIEIHAPVGPLDCNRWLASVRERIWMVLDHPVRIEKDLLAFVSDKISSIYHRGFFSCRPLVRRRLLWFERGGDSIELISVAARAPILDSFAFLRIVLGGTIFCPSNMTYGVVSARFDHRGVLKD
jgi:hypothetical protein